MASLRRSKTSRALSLPRARRPFRDKLPSWAGFRYFFAASKSRRTPPPEDGTIAVHWEYGSDDEPTAAQDAAYAYLKNNEQAVTLAILRSLLVERREREDVHAVDETPRELAEVASVDRMPGIDVLRAAMGAPRVFVLEREHDGIACLGFLIPCVWEPTRSLDVVMHGSRMVKIGGRARRDLASILSSLGRFREALDLRRADAQAKPGDLRVLDRLIGAAMEAAELGLAAEHAARYAELRGGTRFFPVRRADDPEISASACVPRILTAAKLAHDIEQFQYLQRRGVLAGELEPIVSQYETVLERVKAEGRDARVPMDEDARGRIGHVYKRIVHARATPRVGRALSPEWSATQAEDDYLARRPNAVVIDRFLTDEAIESLRHFCLESTIWSTNRYGQGRLGTFFRDGFNCPLLIQIAEELRDALPRVIGARHPLRQLWAFKYASVQPKLGAHADFAAVNVNFWITPDEANLRPGSGGLILYDVAAPPHWDFETYNTKGERIQELLAARNARPTQIPYRYNRAVIFDSDLFHATEALAFEPSYENRRINVTLLFGDRRDDPGRPP